MNQLQTYSIHFFLDAFFYKNETADEILLPSIFSSYLDSGSLAYQYRLDDDFHDAMYTRKIGKRVLIKAVKIALYSCHSPTYLYPR